MKKLILISLFLVNCATSTEPTHRNDPNGIQWVGWSDDLFTHDKLVILDLEAIWCHWCHVMEEKTYSHPKVIELIKSKFIAVRVDQDSRPDLANRYDDYGWPATIIFDSKGVELEKLSGFVDPDEMIGILNNVIKNPKPHPDNKKTEIKISESPYLSKELRKKLQKSNETNFDFKNGSWGFSHKFLEWHSTENMLLNLKSNKKAKSMVQKTLDGQMNILDPAWGGVYQYSTGGVWTEPHFEKIMSMQAENLRLFSLGYMYFQDAKYLKAAKEIHRFLKTFLQSPDGAFYTSQDADLVQGEHSDAYFQLSDSERRKMGIPRIDKNIYARENGWTINALTYLYSATGDAQYLEEAKGAANWILKNRSFNGGFRHGEKDTAGPFLGDTLSMVRSFVSLYTVTAEKIWLQRAVDGARFIDKNFKSAKAGFVTAVSMDPLYQPKPLRDENVFLVTTTNILFHNTGDPEIKSMAEHGMKFLASPAIADERPFGAVLLADKVMGSEPTHMTVVGGKNDPAAQKLFLATLNYPAAYRRVEFWDKSEGNLPRNDVNYPQLDRAAAFACSQSRCSLPAFSPEELKVRVNKLYE